MNAINVIHPYRYEGMWVFDDETRELDKEPFVAGADTYLDLLCQEKPGCTLVFSQHKFPGADLELEFLRPESGGSMYLATQHNHEMWLCPALLKYFKTPPAKIYFQIKLN